MVFTEALSDCSLSHRTFCKYPLIILSARNPTTTLEKKPLSANTFRFIVNRTTSSRTTPAASIAIILPWVA